MTPLQALIDARALLAEPERWTLDGLAIDKCGERCIPTGRAAVAWDVAGALIRTSGWKAALTGPTNATDEWSVWHAAATAFGEAAMPEVESEHADVAWAWDHRPERTHAEVLAAFDAAIARLEAQQ